jgi:hypothetical protein
MSTEFTRTPTYSSAAERMRLYRKRRRDGIQYVRMPLHAKEVQDLIWMGHLGEGQRHDAEAIQAAVLGVFHSAMDEMRDGFMYRARAPIKPGRSV